jgi:Tol biopolymer transport system component
VSELTWAHDGSSIFFKAAEAKSAEDKAREKARDDVYLYDENYKQTHVWNVAIASKAESRITDGDFSVTEYELSADGRRMAYLRAPTPLLGDGDKSEVWVSNADGTNAVQVTRNAVQETGPAISPDNATVLFVSGSNAKFETYYNGRLFVAPAGVARRGSRERRNSTWTAPSGRRMGSRSTSSQTSAFMKARGAGFRKQTAQITNGKPVSAGCRCPRLRHLAFIAANSAAPAKWTMAAAAEPETDHARVRLSRRDVSSASGKPFSGRARTASRLLHRDYPSTTQPTGSTPLR